MDDEQTLHEVLSLANDEEYDEELDTFVYDDQDTGDAPSSPSFPDCRNFSLEEYKAEIMRESKISSSIIFSAIFSDGMEDVSEDSGNLPHFVVCGSSSGRVSTFTLDSLVQTEARVEKHIPSNLRQVATPAASLVAHEGPVYQVITCRKGPEALLFSCGDDGRVCGWRWSDLEATMSREDNSHKDVSPPPRLLELRNEQQRGPRGALASAPETNGIAVDEEKGCLYSATGDCNAYSWDLTTGQRVMTFGGHSAYLHCIATRPSHQQIITGSEDGTACIWDCRSGVQVAIFDPWKAAVKSSKTGGTSPWVSCLALDASENWLVCGSGGLTLTLFSLPSLAATLRIATPAPPQAALMLQDEIVSAGAEPVVTRWSMGGSLVSEISSAPSSVFSLEAHQSGVTMVAGYGGLVDVHSELGSHLSTFRCS